jgi:hypothetical protein
MHLLQQSNPKQDPRCHASLGSAKLSMGAQVGFDVRANQALTFSGDINLGSLSQSSDEYFSRTEQSFGGGVSVFGYGVSVASSRSVRNVPGGGNLTDAPWIGPVPTIGWDSPAPGVSPGLSAPNGDVYFDAGVDIVFGIDLQLNLSELGRRLGGGC